VNISDRRKCVEYALDVLLGRDSAKKYKSKIRYQNADAGISDDSFLYIAPSGFFDDGYGMPASLPVLPLMEIEGVPLLYGSPRVERKGKNLVVYADIIASTFFLVTRYEEIVRRGVRDKYGRFPGKESLPYRAGFIERPIVEDYARLLRKWLREIGIDIKEPQRKFSVVLTHDVDSIQKYWRISQPLREIAKTLLGNKPFFNIIESVMAPLGLKRDPYDNFAELIKLAKNAGDGPSRIKYELIFFFMAGGDSKYDLRKKNVRNIISTVQRSGAKIGLHTSYEAGLKPELICKEKKLLEEACGFQIYLNRYHFLAWLEVKDGWALSNAGIDWDSTLGYFDVAGFRLGVCHPIELFDPIRMELFGIEEHPLIVMDETLSRSSYMNFNEDEAFEYCKRLIEQTRKNNGEFVMLWHNVGFAWDHQGYHSRIYKRLLDELFVS